MATQSVDMADFPQPVRRPNSWLPIAVKRRMVELFATFHGVSQVGSAIKAEFGLELDQRDIATYDPSRPRCRMGKLLLSHYNSVRAAYIEETAQVSVAHRAHRLRLLTNIVEKATTAKDFGNAIKGLELAAKEMGGVLEGKSEVRHTGNVAHLHLNVDDAKHELRMRLQEVIDGGTLEALPAPPDQPADNEAKSLIPKDNGTDLT